MNSTFNFKMTAGALGALLLATACDSIQSVSTEPYTNLPPEKMVLQGTITGLGSRRSITLMNNGDANNALSFIAPAPTVPNAGTAVVPFSFGAKDVGSPYKIEIKPGGEPFGKTCVVNNGEGVLNKDSPPNITVTCTNSVPRFSVTVNLPANPAIFTGRPNAKVRLVTEEAIYEQQVTSGQTTVTFPDAVFNATGQPNSFDWSVVATTTDEQGVLSKCSVNPATGSNPAANVTTPTVGSCTFSIGGNVAFSVAPGASYTPTPITGLVLQLRDLKGNVRETLAVPDCTPANAAATCAYTFGIAAFSNVNGAHEVVVSTQPNGLACVVANGGSANLYAAGTTNPVSVTTANVRCRAVPPPQKRISGVFRLVRTTYTQTVGVTPPIVGEWVPFDTTVHNLASSNMIGFFADGTFLYGTHANSTQVEHGFYDYDPVTQKLRFSLITDTNTGSTFPTNFSLATPTPGVNANSASVITQTTNGISALPNSSTATPPAVNGIQARSMTGVTFGSKNVSVVLGTVNGAPQIATQTVRTIAGTFGDDTAAPFSTSSSRVEWLLEEPISLDNEMTGTWMQRDHRRFWVYDFRNYYGTSVAVAGGAASMNDACFTMEDLHQSEGIYTRRGTISLCLPFSRPAASNTSYAVGFVESVDFSSPAASAIPGFIGRWPGGQSAADGRSPSPIRFKIAPAVSFQSDPVYFTEPDVPHASWCSTEILAVRATLHDNPIDYPLYLCRTRAALP